MFRFRQVLPMGDVMDEAERRIRQLRIDARAQQEDAEAAVAELARASRTLRDAVLDHARAGRQFRIEIGETNLTGSVVHVGSGLVRVAGVDTGAIDVALDAVTGLQATASDRAATSVSTGYPDTLVARARELVQVNARVEIGRRVGRPVRGDLVAVSTTHLELDGGEDRIVLVPLENTASIRRINA